MKVCFYDDMNDEFVVKDVSSLEETDPRFHFGEVEFAGADAVVQFKAGLSDDQLAAKTEAKFNKLEENTVGWSE